MKGAYILLFKITKDFSRAIGSLGPVHFEKGNYAYVGSAQSSLFPRLERHYARKKRLHWHVDYLTTSRYSIMKETVTAFTDKKSTECLLSAKLSELPFSKDIPHFGSSDCKCNCKSHLFKLNTSWKRLISSILSIYEESNLHCLIYK